MNFTHIEWHNQFYDVIKIRNSCFVTSLHKGQKQIAVYSYFSNAEDYHGVYYFFYIES